ncbi:prohibitin family protein [candidate division WOR-3 bacterium]|nr:prohibitin family protein [candidate division WOR-3 bacterium]
MTFMSFLFFLFAFAGGISLIALKKKPQGISVLVIFLILSFFAQTLTVIDAGEIGLQVLFGKVLPAPMREGLHVKNPLARIVTYSIRLQEYTMSIAPGEGARYTPDPITARTLDNSEVTIDITILWTVNPESAATIYSKVATSTEGLKDLLVRPASRAILRDVISTYKLDECFKQRDDIRVKLMEDLSLYLNPKGIIVDNVLLRNITPPASVDIAIQEKLAAEQQLQRREYEIAITRQDSVKRVVEAGGIAAAQLIISSNLTDRYIQWNAVEAIKTLGAGGNSVFYVIPTNPSSSGVPIILNSSR